MDEKGDVTGLECMAGDTSVFVAQHPSEDGYLIKLTTGDVVTAFGIRAATLEAVLGLVMRQGGVKLPGMPVLFALKGEQS